MRSGREVRPDPGPALLDLYDSALPQVYGYLLARCRRRALAEDLTAETFLAAVTACRRQPAPTPSMGWLVGIARVLRDDHGAALAIEETRRNGDDVQLTYSIVPTPAPHSTDLAVVAAPTQPRRQPGNRRRAT